ncbi:hypothetical protein F4809DRAFT_644821 [Biscogniauxia mediterranea]|nr:hypothetical protein F4809DRAFT_644821 [Biscogniauxia mediterranea]
MSYQQGYIGQGAWPGNANMALVPQNNMRLDIDEALQQHTNSYRGFISNWDQAMEVDRQYKATCNQVDTDGSDFPADEGLQQELVRGIVEAIVNTKDVLEKDTNFAVKKIVDKKYSDIELELVGWKVLIALKSAQDGQNELRPWYCEGGPRYARFDSFMDRFNEIVRILRVSKDMVKNIFTNDMFRDRLAWNPRIEYSRKETNRSGNYRKGTVCRIGLEQLARERALRLAMEEANKKEANDQGVNDQGANDQGANDQGVNDQGVNDQGANDQEDSDEDINNRPAKKAKRKASQSHSRSQRPAVNSPRRPTTTTRRQSSSIRQPAVINNPQTPRSQPGMAIHGQQPSPTHQQYLAHSPQVQGGNNAYGEPTFSSPQRPVANGQQTMVTTPGRQAFQTQQQSVANTPNVPVHPHYEPAQQPAANHPQAVVANNGLTFPAPQQPIAPAVQQPVANLPQNVAINQDGLTFPAPQQPVEDIPQLAAVNQNGLTFPAPQQSTPGRPQNAAIIQNGLTFPTPQQPSVPNTPQTAANSLDSPALPAQQPNVNQQQAGVTTAGGLTFPAPVQSNAGNPQTPQARSNVIAHGEWSSPAVPSPVTSGPSNTTMNMSTPVNADNTIEDCIIVASSPMNNSHNMHNMAPSPSGNAFDYNMMPNPVNAAGHNHVNYHAANDFNDPENDTSVRFIDAPDVQGNLFGDGNLPFDLGNPNFELPQDMNFQLGQPNNNAGYQYGGAQPDFNNQYANYDFGGNNYQQANEYQDIGNHQANGHQDFGNNNDNQANPMLIDPQLVNNMPAGHDVFMGDDYGGNGLGLENVFPS